MKPFFVLFTLLLTNFIYAQTTPMYTWVSGAGSFNQQGVYGTKGVAASSNNPGGRENSMSWVDANNNLWLFGGHGYSTNSNQGYLNDLWKYNNSTNQWMWVSGNNTSAHVGIYGTKGTPAVNNCPGARQNGVTWTDSSGNLWLFGGQGYAASGLGSYLNDLWKYDVTANQWTWISGSDSTLQPSVYGTLGVASTTNVPGARFGAIGWIDNSNNLWLFGGQGTDTAIFRYGDLWKYSIANNEWTWMNGANVKDQNGVYGTKGVAAASNTPGARQASASWKDANGNFWLHAGYGFPASGAHSYLNDLWKYDVAVNEWTWVNGSNITNQTPTYGTVGVTASTNMPGARQMTITWVDANNTFWMFGGWGYAQSGFGRMSDLWKYDVTSNQWTWVKAPNLPNSAAIYGTQGVAANTNVPGARRMSISWTDNSGKCWLFGGNGYDAIDSLGLLSDLWSFETSTTTGISVNQEKDQTFMIYPNPAITNEITIIVSAAKPQQIELVDSSGKTLLSKTIENKVLLDISKLSAGTYLLKSNGCVKRFVKQ